MNFIFDFDGTLADSLPAMITVFNKIMRGSNDPLTQDEIGKLRGMSSRKAMRHLGVRWWQIPKLLMRGMPDFKSLIPTLKSFDDLPKVLDSLQKRGDKLYVVTSNTNDSVEEFLRLQKMDHYFTDIVTGAGLFKKSKHIRKLIKTHDLKRKETVYVGDETRDIQAARSARVRIVSVTWGFNTKAVLSRRRPNFIVDEPRQLLEIS